MNTLYVNHISIFLKKWRLTRQHGLLWRLSSVFMLKILNNPVCTVLINRSYLRAKSWLASSDPFLSTLWNLPQLALTTLTPLPPGGDTSLQYGKDNPKRWPGSGTWRIAPIMGKHVTKDFGLKVINISTAWQKNRNRQDKDEKHVPAVPWVVTGVSSNRLGGLPSRGSQSIQCSK